MLQYTQLSNKSDVISFIVFKRQLRAQIKRLLNCIYVLLSVGLLVLGIYHKNKLIAVGDKISQTMIKITDYLFTTKIEKIAIHLPENTLLDTNDISDITKQISYKSIDRQHIIEIIKNLKANNSIIDKVSIRKTLVDGNVDLYITEKKIIGILIPEECNNIKYCSKQMIAKNNKILDYHHINDTSNILKIFGDVGRSDVDALYNLLKKNNLLHKVSYVKFYTSGRFDLILTNELAVKFPRSQWKETMQRFVKLDSEYMFSSGYQNIKYLDIRIPNKIFVGEKQ